MSFCEIKTRSMARIEIPVQFSRLRDIAYNVWWSWSARAQSVFQMIDQTHWLHYRSPIETLIDLEPERWYFLQNDAKFVEAYRELVEEFDSYMMPERPTWFDRQYPDSPGPIAYFSTEYGWHESLQSYSGGLGILSGDHSKSASDLGLPFVGIGLMYRRGYFRQTIDAEGQQQHFYPNYDVYRLPLLPVLDDRGNELRESVELAGRRVSFRVWRASVGRVPVLLLDCDIPANHPADRAITSILYVSGREMRLCQEIVLGIGGVKVLRALGIEPSVWHMNEGHSALLSLERIAEARAAGAPNLDAALEQTAKTAVFTTHTPVPAGNESFDGGMVRNYLTDWAGAAGVDLDELLPLGSPDTEKQDPTFNMTALGIRTSCRANGVSRLHGDVAHDMWKHLIGDRKVEYVTNGVHLPTWIGKEIRDVLRKHLGPKFVDDLLDPGFPAAVEAIPEREIWDAHCAQKRDLISLARELVLSQFSRHGRSPEELHSLDTLFDPGALLIGFARRFATYKRPDLLLRDLEQIKTIARDADRPVQFMFAGKAHPADRPGQDLIRRIFQASLSPELAGRLLFLENYDMRIGRGMVQGVDVWLNNPRRPMEASGTSGMKAAMNGGLNCSVNDGWWCEGYDPSHGWVIGTEQTGDEQSQDQHDSADLYRVFREEIIPCFYDRDPSGLPVQWARRMKRAIGTLSPQFSTERMVSDYTRKFYVQTADEDARPKALAETQD
jgi:starch phosphorylase